MTYESLVVDVDDRGVATVTLNRPEQHNSMSGIMITELANVTQDLAANNKVRVVVLTGSGKSFCAGGDLGWMQQQFEADRETRINEALKLARMLKHLNELPKPLIGKVNGQAFGGGIGLISVCDVAIGLDSAQFALTETRLGLIPATISPYVIARLGQGNARRVFMSGQRFGSAEAISLGLLAKTSPAENLDADVELEIEPYLSTAPGAVAKAKALALSYGSVIDEALLKKTAEKLADCWEDPEAHEGITAFFEKRRPSWRV